MEGHLLDPRIVQRRDVIKGRIEICQIKSRLAWNAEARQVGLCIDEGRRLKLAKNAFDIITAGAQLEVTGAVDRHLETGAGLRPAASSNDVAAFGLNTFHDEVLCLINVGVHRNASLLVT